MIYCILKMLLKPLQKTKSWENVTNTPDNENTEKKKLIKVNSTGESIQKPLDDTILVEPESLGFSSINIGNDSSRHDTTSNQVGGIKKIVLQRNIRLFFRIQLLK